MSCNYLRTRFQSNLCAAAAASGNFLEFYSLKSLFQGFWVIQTGFQLERCLLLLKIYLLWKMCPICVKRWKSVWIRACIPCLAREDILSWCLRQTHVCGISLYRKCEILRTLAQVSVVQARESSFSSDDVIVDQITPKLHRKAIEQRIPVLTGIQVLKWYFIEEFVPLQSCYFSLFPIQPLYYVPYKTLLFLLEPPGTRLVHWQARTYGSL